LREWAKSGQQNRQNTSIGATAAATAEAAVAETAVAEAAAAEMAPTGGICWSMTF